MSSKGKKGAATKEQDIRGSSQPTNKPRNLLITDATSPFSVSFQGRFNIRTEITVEQTAREDIWPGGALWDVGVLLAQVFAVSSAKGYHLPITLTTDSPILSSKKGQACEKSASQIRHIQLPARFIEALESKSIVLDSPISIVELGCGVGFTGMVAAVALTSEWTLLTDLEAVIEGITRPNMEKNVSSTQKAKKTVLCDVPFRNISAKSKVAALPLCWGSSEDEEHVKDILEKLPIQSTQTQTKRKNQSKSNDSLTSNRNPQRLIIVADVAYQQRPGAPSHFDALVATILSLTDIDPQTLVVFGTRIRMPASNDLLYMLLEHFDEQLTPPLSAEEIDPMFRDVKHNMSIHFLRRKQDEKLEQPLAKGTT